MDMIPKLEEFVDAQVQGHQEYLFEANHRLIKLYQLFSKHNVEYIAKICCLALSSYPSTDLLALTYMIPVHILKDETSILPAITECSKLLQNCQFQEFWTKSQSLTYLDSGKLRSGILDVLALSYKEAPLEVVTKAIHSQDVGAHPSVESVTSSHVVFVSTANNTHRERVYQEGVSYASVSSLMAKMAQ